MSNTDIIRSVLPVIFVTHGAGPMMFLEAPSLSIMGEVDKHSPAAKWFRQLATQLALSPPPKAILVISAHWETTHAVHITAKAQHTELYYDYYGFPPEAYELKYNPPGDVDLAHRIKSLFDKANIPATLDTKHNFDHGVFIPLKLAYPHADIPVVEISVLDCLSPSEHLAIGKALAPLRQEQVLIIGSGAVVHGSKTSLAQCDQFVDTLTRLLTQTDAQEREKALLNWEKTLPYARDNHPREEHFIPLHVVVGAAGSDSGQIFNPTVVKTQAAYKFGV